MRRIEVEITKKGFPALWERGGGCTNTGEATIIAGKDGRAKKAIYIRKRGELANAEHALLPIEVGDYIVEADHHRGDFCIEVSEIVGFEEEKEETLGTLKERLSSEAFEKKYKLSFEDIESPIEKGPLGYPMKAMRNIYIVSHPWGTHNIYPKVEETRTHARVRTVASFGMGEWEPELPEHLKMAVDMAKAKATDYHCRESYFYEGSPYVKAYKIEAF